MLKVLNVTRGVSASAYVSAPVPLFPIGRITCSIKAKRVDYIKWAKFDFHRTVEVMTSEYNWTELLRTLQGRRYERFQRRMFYEHPTDADYLSRHYPYPRYSYPPYNIYRY